MDEDKAESTLTDTDDDDAVELRLADQGERDATWDES
jgi:hypothetical protein